MDKVLVVTTNYSTSLGVCRALGMGGFCVELLYITNSPGISMIVSSSRYVSRAEEFIGRNDEAIIEHIISHHRGEDRVLLFPTDDYTVSLLDRYADRICDSFLVFRIIDGKAGSVTSLMDKYKQAQLAGQSGLNTPLQWTVDLKEESPSALEDIVYPCFVKPLASVDGRKTEMRRCESRGELTSCLSAMRSRDAKRSVLIQEFLNIENEYAISGISAADRVVIPAVVKKRRIAKYERGVTLLGELVSTDEISAVYDPVISFIKSLHYTGMFDMELIRASGKWYFGEFNFRSGGPNYSYTGFGSNLPAAIACYMFRGKEINVPEPRLGGVFLSEKVAWDDYMYSLMTKDELTSLYRESDIRLIESKDDPAPNDEFMRYIKLLTRKTRLRRLARRILHRG